MPYTRFLLSLLILLVLGYDCYATDFVVTSNADAGPGTLREALTLAAANGTTTADVIKFNLPGNLVSDRTIRLKSMLPVLTSNLTIDGTTQPGNKFGVSDAKVIIEPETSPAYFSGLQITGDLYGNNNPAQKIAIYGLYIRNFAKITNLGTPDLNQGSGIVIQGEAKDIKIGAPGKGNVICGNINGVVNYNSYYYNTVADIFIQGNIIGLLDDGYTANCNINGLNFTMDGSITVGGAAANTGNVISANVTGISVVRNYYYSTLPVTVLVQNNKIGTNYAGTADFKNHPLFQQSAFLKTYGININAANTTSRIKDNIISGQRFYGMFLTGTTYTIESNKIGTDVTGKNDLGNGEGIMAGEATNGTIGGTDADQKNLIGYNSYGIEVLNSSHTLITRNSIFCNSDYGINVSSHYYSVPFVKVLTFSGTKVSGIATPNSKIELFYSDDCPNACQGKTYLPLYIRRGWQMGIHRHYCQNRNSNSYRWRQ